MSDTDTSAEAIEWKVVTSTAVRRSFCAARLPDSTRVFAGASDGNIYDVDPAAERPEFKPLEGHTSYVAGVALAGEWLVSGGYDCQLMWRRVDSGAVVQRQDAAHARWIRKVVAAPDGRCVASVADDMVARVWDVPSGRLRHELRGHAERTPHHFPSMLYTCAFSADGRWLATADKTGRICIWDVERGTRVQQIEATGFYTWDPRQRLHSIGGIRAVAFSPDGKQLVAGGIGQIRNIDHLDGPARVEVFDLASAASLHVFAGETKGLVEDLAFHPDGKWLLGAGGDNAGCWLAYDLAEKKLCAEKAPMHIHAVALCENGKQLAAVGHGRVLLAEVG